MSNVEARVARTLSPPGGEPFELRGGARRGALAAKGIRRRRLFAAGLFAVDIVSGTMAIVAAAVIVAVVRPAGQTGLIGPVQMQMQIQMCVLLLLLIGINCSLGLYRTNIKSPMERFRLRATATLLFAFAGMLMWIREGPSIELAIVPLVGAISFVLGCWIEHLIGVRLARSDVYRAPTAILGAGASSRALARLLLSNPACGLCPIGFIDDGACSDDVVDEVVPLHGAGGTSAALPVLGTLDGWRADGSAEVVIVPDCEVLPRDPAALYRLGARQVLVINRLGEYPSFGLQFRNAGCFVALELGGQPRDPSEGLKRAIDLALALALLLLAAPIIGLLALTIKLADPGPAFYGQWRIGRYGTPIRVLKLRTMYRDAEQRLERVLASDPGLRKHWERHFKLPRDPRILSRVGNLLRRSS